MPRADRIARDVEQLVRAIRDDLANDRCCLLPTRRLEARALAGAGLAHAAVLLERMDVERRSGDDLVARLIARAHYETFVTTMYLVLSPTEAAERLIQAHKGDLLAQDKDLTDANKRIRVANKRLRNSSAHARADQIDPALLQKELDLDLPKSLSNLAMVEKRKLSIKEIDRRVGELSQAEGERWQDNYAFLYRSLSRIGAHPTYWVLDSYLTTPGSLVHIAPRTAAHPLATTAVRSGLLLTAVLAGRVFKSFDVDAEVYDSSTDKILAGLRRDLPLGTG